MTAEPDRGRATKDDLASRYLLKELAGLTPPGLLIVIPGERGPAKPALQHESAHAVSYPTTGLDPTGISWTAVDGAQRPAFHGLLPNVRPAVSLTYHIRANCRAERYCARRPGSSTCSATNERQHHVRDDCHPREEKWPNPNQVDEVEESTP